MSSLTDIERDALAETFNIAFGDAIAALADIVREEVEMSVPALELLDTDQLLEHLARNVEPAAEGAAPVLCCIGQQFAGAGMNFSADAMLLFPALGSVHLVRRMLGAEDIDHDNASELEQDALAELGNIVINSCMTNLAGIFDAELVGTLPRVRTGRVGELMPRARAGKVALSMQLGMTLAGRRLTGMVLLIMDAPSLAVTIQRVRAHFGLELVAAA